MPVTFISKARQQIVKVDTAMLKKMKMATAVLKRETLKTFQGERTGHTYRVPGTGAPYTASAPGEPPAVATESGKRSIRETVRGKGHTVTGYVGSAMGYGRHPVTSEDAAIYMSKLEFEGMNRDGSRRAARPWLGPSAKRANPKMKAALRTRWF